MLKMEFEQSNLFGKEKKEKKSGGKGIMKMEFEQSNFLGKEQRWREADKYLAWIRITKIQY